KSYVSVTEALRPASSVTWSFGDGVLMPFFANATAVMLCSFVMLLTLKRIVTGFEIAGARSSLTATDAFATVIGSITMASCTLLLSLNIEAECLTKMFALTQLRL